MTLVDPQHLPWSFVLIPSIIIAAAINLDNRFLGPYFAVVDVVFNDFGTGYKWCDREILLSLTRRIAYLVGSGIILRLCNYRLPDISAVFLVAGFLMIWPAFARPLPVYARKSDWHVLLVWGLYVISVVAFGMFGATFLSLIQAITGQSPWKFIRDALLGSAFLGCAGLIATAFRVPLQKSLWQQGRNRPRRSEGGQ